MAENHNKTPETKNQDPAKEYEKPVILDVEDVDSVSGGNGGCFTGGGAAQLEAQ